jgi:hypothetical protein
MMNQARTWLGAGLAGGLACGAFAAGPFAKVNYRGEGLYGIGLEELAGAAEISVEEMRTRAANGQLALTDGGEPVAMLHDGGRDRLVFHGKAGASWYTPEAAVLIAPGAGMVMGRRSPGAEGGSHVFEMTACFEEDVAPFDSARNQAGDFFYWEYVLAGNATYGTRHFPVDLAGHAGGDVELRVRLMAWSAYPTNGAEILVNGQVAGAATFGAPDPVDVAATVPAAWISNGMNTVSVRGFKPAGAKNSAFAVDRIEATFLRTPVPTGGTMHFEPAGAGTVSAAAYAEPLAVALDAAGVPTWLADAGGALPGKAWAVAADDVRYALAEADDVALLAVEAISPPPWFLAATNRLDYLVVTSRELEEAARELADYRSGQGLRTGVAVFADICDWMAGGVRTPEAIPALLAQAHETWAEAPWMLVLAGSGHYDYLNGLNLEGEPPAAAADRDVRWIVRLGRIVRGPRR